MAARPFRTNLVDAGPELDDFGLILGNGHLSLLLEGLAEMPFNQTGCFGEQQPFQSVLNVRPIALESAYKEHS